MPSSVLVMWRLGDRHLKSGSTSEDNYSTIKPTTQGAELAFRGVGKEEKEVSLECVHVRADEVKALKVLGRRTVP